MAKEVWTIGAERLDGSIALTSTLRTPLRYRAAAEAADRSREKPFMHFVAVRLEPSWQVGA